MRRGLRLTLPPPPPLRILLSRQLTRGMRGLPEVSRGPFIRRSSRGGSAELRRSCTRPPWTWKRWPTRWSTSCWKGHLLAQPPAGRRSVDGEGRGLQRAPRVCVCVRVSVAFGSTQQNIAWRRPNAMAAEAFSTMFPLGRCACADCLQNQPPRCLSDNSSETDQYVAGLHEMFLRMREDAEREERRLGNRGAVATEHAPCPASIMRLEPPDWDFLARPVWVDDEKLDSQAMLSAFLRYIQGLPAVQRDGFISQVHIIEHCVTDKPLPTPGGIRAVACTDKDCKRCTQGWGGYQFRWYHPLWYHYYKDLCRPGSWHVLPPLAPPV